MTTTVQQVLGAKGDKVHCIAPETTVRVALETMAAYDIGAVLVVEDGHLLGIFTERDYARKVALKGLASQTAKVSELMTHNVLTVSPTHSIEQVMAIMTNNRFRHLPVVDHGQLAGIITIGDVVKAVIAEQEETIRHLSSYISGEIASS